MGYTLVNGGLRPAVWAFGNRSAQDWPGPLNPHPGRGESGFDGFTGPLGKPRKHLPDQNFQDEPEK